MAEEEYQIPIFFINGQLDSGKTRFITETIEMGQFAEAKNKLLIVCEEGEEEYDEKMLKDNGVSMVVLEKEDLTEEKLKELDKQYDPWIVIVEYLSVSYTHLMTRNVAADMTMTTRNMNIIITTMMANVAADMTITMKDIIMQMTYSQAGVQKHRINTTKKHLKTS